MVSRASGTVSCCTFFFANLDNNGPPALGRRVGVLYFSYVPGRYCTVQFLVKL